MCQDLKQTRTKWVKASLNSSSLGTLPASLRLRTQLQILGGFLRCQCATLFVIHWHVIWCSWQVAVGGAVVVGGGGSWWPTVGWCSAHWLERAHVHCELCRAAGAEENAKDRCEWCSLFESACTHKSSNCNPPKPSIVSDLETCIWIHCSDHCSLYRLFNKGFL